METKRNIYVHKIKLAPLKIKNQPREKFRKLLEAVKYRGYKVENIKGGRKIVITKPGGKLSYGKAKREDFMVWIYNSRDSTLWLISHKDIYEDLKEKSKINTKATIKILNALGKVYKGKEPT